MAKFLPIRPGVVTNSGANRAVPPLDRLLSFALPQLTDPSNVLEYITYAPFPREQGATAPSTLFKQHALMHSAFPTRMVARRIEKASVDRFKANAENGKKGFDWVLRKGLELSGNVNGNGAPSLA